MYIAVSGLCASSGQARQNQSKNELFDGFIYFANTDQSFLKSVKRNFPSSLDDHSLALQIIKSVIQGPGSDKLSLTWSTRTKLNAVFISGDNSAYVDLDVDPDWISRLDTRSEMLAVYSVVNSLIVNIPRIKRVKILIKGRDAPTLAGHIDLEPFYKTNMLIVK